MNDTPETQAAAHNKPRWRTPKLTVDSVGDVTRGDYVLVGNDGGDASHAHGFTTPS